MAISCLRGGYVLRKADKLRACKYKNAPNKGQARVDRRRRPAASFTGRAVPGAASFTGRDFST